MIVSMKKLRVGIIAICNMIIMILVYLSINEIPNLTEWCYSEVLFITILFIAQITYLKVILPKQRVLIYVFICLTYIFHVSHIYLKFLDYEFPRTLAYGNIFNYSFETVKESAWVSVMAIIAIFIGIIVYHIFYRENIYNASVGYKHKKVTLNHIFIYLLIIIGWGFDLLYYVMVYAFTAKGYANMTELSYSFLLKVPSYCLLPGILGIIIDKSFSKKFKNRVVAIFLFYKLTSMITGLRAYSLINMVIVMYVHYRANMKKVNFFKWIILSLVLLQFGGGLLVAVREMRFYGIDVGEIAVNLFSVKKNLLFDLIAEFGGTQGVICREINTFEGVASGGRQLFSSILSIIPKISYLIDLNYTKMSLESAMNSHNMGGSYIADLLFDFGRSGIIASGIVLGSFFAWFYEKYDSAIRFGNQKVVVIFAPIVVEFIYCVRSSLSKMPRLTCWYLVLYFMLDMIFNRKSISRVSPIQQE